MASLHWSTVLFDLDGTLVDTLPATFHAFQDAVEPDLGRRPTREEILARFGPADHEIVAEWVGAETAEAAVARLYASYGIHLTRCRPFPGIEFLLSRLAASGRSLGLFTGRGRPSTDTLLEGTGLGRFFPAVVTGEEVPRPKPAPDGIRRVLDLLGADLHGAVYVGDTVNDLRCAQAAGVDFLGALWASPERDALAQAAEFALTGVDDLTRALGVALS